jgi:hypothetical protein
MSAHCWHDLPGFRYANGARRYVCCHCNALADGSLRVSHVAPPGHGPHAPLETRTEVVAPHGGTCPLRPRDDRATYGAPAQPIVIPFTRPDLPPPAGT